MLALTSLIAFILALFLATIGAAAGAAGTQPEAAQAAAPTPAEQPPSPSAGQPSSYEGIVTDTHCGAKHSSRVGKTAADCTRVCVHAGEHFALVDGDKAYTLEGNLPALKLVAGERVKVTGTLSGNTISVTSVVANAS